MESNIKFADDVMFLDDLKGPDLSDEEFEDFMEILRFERNREEAQKLNDTEENYTRYFMGI